MVRFSTSCGLLLLDLQLLAFRKFLQENCKKTTFLLLPADCVFLRRKKLLRHFLRALFLGCTVSNKTVLYTAISIYVVGSKLQAYKTRPKGGMGKLELILRFRGCRREMDMEAENTISIVLCVLTKSNKNR